MTDRYQIGVLGMTHDHLWQNLSDLNSSVLGELVAAADPHPALRDRVREEYGCQAVYESYEEMLDQETLDAVYVYADNAAGPDLTVMAAQSGLHVMIEKPMAADLDGAQRMLAATKSSGVLLMVNWPFAWWPALQQAISMAASGEIGHVFGTRYRAAHGGPKEYGCTPFFYEWLYDAERNGAGALMDYCGYGVALARRVLGMPSRVMGAAGHLYKDYVTVDDNAVIVMQWARAMATSEASWLQIGNLTSYEAVLYGSDGTLFVERGGRRLWLATREDPNGVALDLREPPPEKLNATAHFLHSIRTGNGVDALCSAEVGRDAQEILEAGLLSAVNGEAISLPLPVY